MAKAKQFSENMTKRGKEAAEGTNRIKRQVALAVHAAVTFATPVATGRARNNWLAEINHTPPGTPGTPGKNPTDAPDPAPRVKSIVGVVKPGETIHIANNLPYIGRLNEGHSAQAPAGFVQEAIQVGVAAIRNAGPVLKQ